MLSIFCEEDLGEEKLNTTHTAHSVKRPDTDATAVSSLSVPPYRVRASLALRISTVGVPGFFLRFLRYRKRVGESSPRLRRMARLRDHAQAFTQGLTAVGSSAAVLKRVEVDDEGICVTVTLERGGRASGLTLIFEVCEKRTHHPVPPFRFVTLGSAYFFLVLTSRGSARRATCDVATTNESEKIEEHTRSRRRRD